MLLQVFPNKQLVVLWVVANWAEQSTEFLQFEEDVPKTWRIGFYDLDTWLIDVNWPMVIVFVP